MDEVEEIKRKIDIVDLISSYLTLKKAGANYRSMCPFHSEKTPSMMISPEKQIFKCFGCNEGGDIFSFAMKMENLEFREALEMLAQRAGVKLENRKKVSPDEAPDKKTRLFKINAISAKVFNQILLKHPAGKSALAYLKKRTITEQTIQDFTIGYAPSSRVLKSYMTKQGFTEQEMQNAGNPERFFQRIIFPITDVMGNVLGFTGRTITEGVQPKYLNTPETIIFHKGRILYNLVRARGDIKLEKTTVVVEGQMDVISSYQAGVKNVVATSGTALTPDHLQILYRYTPNIAFSFDSDTAGLATGKKAYEMALAEGFNVKMVDLGDFKDPGEMIEKDPELWKKTVKSAKPVIDWYFELAFKKINNPPAGEEKEVLTSQQKKEIAKEIIPVIRKIPNTIEQAHYVELLARRLDIPDQIIFEALDRQKDDQTKKQDKSKSEVYTKLTLEQILIGLLVVNPEEIQKVAKKLKIENFTDESMQKIYKLLLNWYNDKSNQNLKKFLNLKLGKDSDKLDLIVMEVEQSYQTADQLNVINDLCLRIDELKKENLKAYFAREIAKAESAGEREKLKALIKEFQDAIK